MPSIPHSLPTTTGKNYPNINDLRINEYRNVTIVPTDEIAKLKNENDFVIIDPFLNRNLILLDN